MHVLPRMLFFVRGNDFFVRGNDLHTNYHDYMIICCITSIKLACKLVCGLVCKLVCTQSPIVDLVTFQAVAKQRFGTATEPDAIH